MTNFKTEKKSFEALTQQETLNNLEIDLLVRMGIYEADFFKKGAFLEPCISLVGAMKVSERIRHYYFYGSPREMIEALRLWFWVSGDDLEYRLRESLLIPDLKNCSNPVIRFFYRWALGNQRCDFFEGDPSNFDELKEVVEDNPEYLELYNEVAAVA